MNQTKNQFDAVALGLPPFLNKPEAARTISVSGRTLERLWRDGKIQTAKLSGDSSKNGKRVYVTQTLLDYMASCLDPQQPNPAA